MAQPPEKSVSAQNNTGPEAFPWWKRLFYDAYTIGWICALPKERTAVRAMLDKEHEPLPTPRNNYNTYTLGLICGHNVVIACLPNMGTNPAATVATSMINTFQSIRFGLMVGIGGGIPSKVNLGDVVVSHPVADYHGVEFPRLVPIYTRCECLEDPLLVSERIHGTPTDLHFLSRLWRAIITIGAYLLGSWAISPGNEDWQSSDKAEGARSQREVRVHYGLIASGNKVVKDAQFRDSLNKAFGGHLLCVEMEAAGLMNNFPCIVIQGICDYADSRKEKTWQEYAAAVATAYAKELGVVWLCACR
ncbi:nucleoside phosphorylase domain-containing protein [Aspergillus pseudoustus]|uniref:Nucleoside phosphorylase domain-containing protein n=1 Tax=Aspergillus pseudoustus TaxID=1810923 RepID=A0ABR4JBJ7_9EURO